MAHRLLSACATVPASSCIVGSGSAQAAAKHMVAQKRGGSLISLSSVHAVNPVADWTIYGSCKVRPAGRRGAAHPAIRGWVATLDARVRPPGRPASSAWPRVSPPTLPEPASTPTASRRGPSPTRSQRCAVHGRVTMHAADTAGVSDTDVIAAAAGSGSRSPRRRADRPELGADHGRRRPARRRRGAGGGALPPATPDYGPTKERKTRARMPRRRVSGA